METQWKPWLSHVESLAIVDAYAKWQIHFSRKSKNLAFQTARPSGSIWFHLVKCKPHDSTIFSSLSRWCVLSFPTKAQLRGKILAVAPTHWNTGWGQRLQQLSEGEFESMLCIYIYMCIWDKGWQGFYRFQLKLDWHENQINPRKSW
jgi:hypothetical protein